MRAISCVVLALACVTLCVAQPCSTPPAVVNYNNPFIPELGFKEAKTFYPIYASATAADEAAGVAIIKASPGNLNLRKPFLMGLLNSCGLPFQMSVSEMQKPAGPMAKAVGACVRHLKATNRISTTEPAAAVSEISKKVAKDFAKLDEADYQHIERVLNYSKGTKGRARTVQAALAMVGHVSALNRGDGSKYGWLNIFHFYRRALSKSLFYDKQNTKELWELGNFKKDGKHVKDVWSWCGIFATWAQTAGGLEAAWWKPAAGLQGIKAASGQGPNNIEKAQPGDFLYWSGTCNHMSVFLKYDAATKRVWSIDGNGMEQGVSVNARDVKGLMGWRCTHGCEDGTKTDKLPASFDLQAILTAAKSAKPSASTPPAVGSKAGNSKGGNSAKGGNSGMGGNSAKGGKKNKFF